MTSDNLCQLLFTQAWQVTLVAVTVWCLTRLCLRERPWMAHLLWAGVLLKVVVPPVMVSPIGLFAWPYERPVVTASMPLDPSGQAAMFEWQVIDARADSGRPASQIIDSTDMVQSTSSLIVTIWLSIAGALLLLTAVRCSYFMWRLPGSRLPSTKFEAQLHDVCRRLSLRPTVRLRVVDAAVGPLVCGVWRPLIVLPEKVVERLSEAQVEALLMHEAKHIQRGDLWWAWLQVLATSLGWFHPLVWLASRRLTVESERCCDEAALAALRCQAADYARSLIQVLEFKHQLHSVAAWPGVRPVDITRERLERIMRLGHGCRERASRKQWCLFGLCLLLVLPSGSSIVSQEPGQKAGAQPQLLPLLQPQPIPLLPKSKKVTASTELPATAMPERMDDENQIVIQTRLISITKERLEKLKLDWRQASPSQEELPLGDSNMAAGVATDMGKIMQVPATPCPTFVAMLTGQDLADKLLSEITAGRKTNMLQAPKVTTFEGQVAWISDEHALPFVTKVQSTGQTVVELATEGTEIGMRGRVVAPDFIELTIQWHQKWIEEVGSFQLASRKIQLPQLQHRRLSTQVKLGKDETICLTGGTPVAKEKDVVRLMMVSARQIDPALLRAMPPANTKRKFSLNGPILQPGEKHVHPTADEVATTVTGVVESDLKAGDSMLLKPLSHEVGSTKFVPLIGHAKTHRYTYQFTYGPKSVPVDQHKSVMVDQTVFELVK